MLRIHLLKRYITVTNRLASEEGQALSEYGITLTVVLILAISAATTLGASLAEVIQQSVDILSAI